MIRTSPIFDRLSQLKADWTVINQMNTVTVLPDAKQSDRLGIADLSCFTRFGVKGANAANWLATQNLPIPPKPNSWTPLPDGGLIARLGLTEFLIEDSLNSAIAPQLATQSFPEKVYPVLRQDLSLLLYGEAINDLLLQTCNINFRALNLSDRPVILTSMIGVSVTVIPNETYYRVWCDYTFGNYFWSTLVCIAEELGGGAIGLNQIPQTLLSKGMK